MFITTAIVSLIGLSLGSFLNSCAFRIPRGISLVSPRSYCPSCRRQLTCFELVPVVGYLRNRGKCSSCSSRIGWDHPFVELLVGVMALYCFAQFGPTGESIMLLAFMMLMLLVGIIDWQHLVIPNKLIVFGLTIGLLLKIVFAPDELLASILQAVSAFGTLLVVRLAGNWLFKKETMGMGDVKLALLMGLFLGYFNFLIAVWVASLLGSAYALTLKLCHLYPPSLWKGRGNEGDAMPARLAFGSPKRAVRREFHSESSDVKLPFGSFLAFASCLVMLLTESQICDLQFVIAQWLTLLQ